MQPVIIEAAINGVTRRDRNPHVPITPEEIAADTLACIAAGASVIHNHIEDIRLLGAPAGARYGEGWAPVLAAIPDAILYPTATIADVKPDQALHIAPCARAGARMAALDPGSVNIASSGPDGAPGDTRFAYVNDYDLIDLMVAEMEAAGLAPSIAIYEPTFLRATLAYHRAGRMPHGAMVKFYFPGDYDLLSGGKGTIGFGLPPTRKALDAYLEMMEGSDLPWAVTVLGGDVMGCGIAREALERGGHIRVGLEDYAGEASPTNVELVEQAVALCHAVGRPVASRAQAAEIMGLKSRVPVAA